MKKKAEAMDFHSKTMYEVPECGLLHIDFDPCLTHNAISLQKLIGNKPAYILETKITKVLQLYYTDGQGHVTPVGDSYDAVECRDYFPKKVGSLQEPAFYRSLKEAIDSIESQTGFTRNSLLKEKITKLLDSLNGIYEKFEDSLYDIDLEIDKNELVQCHKLIDLITLFDKVLSKFNNQSAVSASNLKAYILKKILLEEVFLDKQPLLKKADLSYWTNLNPSQLTCDIKTGAYIFYDNTLYFAKHGEKYKKMDIYLDKKSINHFKDYQCTHINGYFLQLWSSKNPFIIKFIKALEMAKEFEKHYDDLFCFIGKEGEINSLLPDCIKGLGQIIGLMYDSVCENNQTISREEHHNIIPIKKTGRSDKYKRICEKYSYFNNRETEKTQNNKTEYHNPITDSTSKCSAYFALQTITIAKGLKIAGVTLLIIGAIAALAGGALLGFAAVNGVAWVAQALLIGGGVAAGTGAFLGLAGIFKSPSAGKDVVNNKLYCSI